MYIIFLMLKIEAYDILVFTSHRVSRVRLQRGPEIRKLYVCQQKLPDPSRRPV